MRWIPPAFFFLAACSFGQQTYVGRWDAYAGYARVMQPSINLAAPGFNIQVGMRPTHWITLGVDYTFGRGQNTVEPGMLLPSVQNQLGTLLRELAGMGLVPPGYQLAVPFNIRAQAIEVGPDFPFRHFQAVTFFVRPNLGALEVVATPRPADPIAALAVSQVYRAGKRRTGPTSMDSAAGWNSTYRNISRFDSKPISPMIISLTTC